MRLLSVLALSLALAACVGASEPEAFTLRPTTSDPDSLLARLDADELAAAFERLREVGYTVTVTVNEFEGDLSTGVFEQTLAVSGDSTRILRTSPPHRGAAPFTLFDPVARLLPKEPPFRNPATREMYTLSRGSLEGPVARATAERREGTDPIRSATVAVDTTTGQVTWAQVSRESRSAVFDESSQATVTTVARDGAWWPASGRLRSEIEVPTSARVIDLEWRVLSIGGVELATDTSSALASSTD